MRRQPFKRIRRPGRHGEMERVSMKIRVGVFFGGKSVEHEVSIISAMQAIAALDKEKYQPVPIYITKDNKFYTGPNLGEIEAYRDIPAALKQATRITLVGGENTAVMQLYPPKKLGNSIVGEIDVILPVTHGTNVEDGALQGFFEYLNIPYAGCDVCASAVGMDKWAMKALFQSAGLPVVQGVLTDKKTWYDQLEAEAAALEQTPWLSVLSGFGTGVLFLLLFDSILPHIHPMGAHAEGIRVPWSRSTLLFFAVTLHNIPEGMAVGLSFALALQHGEAALAAAFALSMGIAIQNLPEGAAVSLPLAQAGVKRNKAFALGMASGAVEPVFAFIVLLCAPAIGPIMPFLLSFAAGAMLYVVAEELIPEAHLGEHSHSATLSVMAGFALMMVLDTALG